MEKKVLKKFGKEYFLLGISKEGEKVYLEDASWDCDWYWGFGYIETFKRDGSDIESHRHFNDLFLKNGISDTFKNFFEETTVDEQEMWDLLETMDCFYICREYSDILHRGGANIASPGELKGVIKNDAEYKRINEEVIPKLIEKVKKILTPEK